MAGEYEMDRCNSQYIFYWFIICCILILLSGCASRQPPHVADVPVITATASEGGSISPPGDVAVTGGTNIYFNMTPDLDYGIVDVKIDGASVGAKERYLFKNVTEPHTIEAEFGPAIVPSVGANGFIGPGSTQIVAKGGGMTFKITPMNGYRVADVLVNGVSGGAVSSYTFMNVTSPSTISATFVKVADPIITATAKGGGSISPSGDVAVTDGTNIYFNMTPAEGYILFDIVVDGEPKGANRSSRYLFKSVTENHTIQAIFHPTIAASASTGGSIRPSGNLLVDDVKRLSNLTYTFIPMDGYHLVDVIVNGKSQGALKSYTFGEVTVPQTIKAIFAQD
jgi:Divergent InlB B-repeat domain